MLPLAIDAAKEISTQAIKAYIGKRPGYRGGRAPYPKICRHIVTAHRYTVRAGEKPDRRAIYYELARQEIGHALSLADETAPSATFAVLSTRLRRAERNLWHPSPDLTSEEIATDLWSISTLALELAEAAR